MNERILVVDDDVSIVEFLELHLLKAGFSVDRAHSAREALEHLARRSADLILLDLVLPDMDGFEVCPQIRERTSVPIIMLTARGDDVDKIVGLEMGADDYVVKPFNPRELVARIRAILRRGKAGTKRPREIELGRLRIEPARRQVLVDGALVDLSHREYDILLALASHPGNLVDRDELLQEVWGDEKYVDARNVDVYVKHLRKKLGIRGLIRTIWGKGYQLVPGPGGQEEA